MADKLQHHGADRRGRRAERAIKEAREYTLGQWYEPELLRRVIWDHRGNGVVERVVIPSGQLRAIYYNGRKYRLTLRRQLLLYFHDSETMGAHSGATATYDKLADMVWWPLMRQDVNKWVATCAVCRVSRPTAALTTEQRSCLYHRPFRVIMVDSVGPIRPAVGPHKLAYILHASCPFTNYCWFKAVPTIEKSEVAKFLVEEVYFDLAGFPAVLRSDRGGEFINDVVKAVNDLLGVDQAFGAAWHPQSQGHIEGGHNKLNAMLATYAETYPESWPTWMKFCQWSVRSTPRADKGGFSPYELVTGLKPHGPLHQVFERFNDIHQIPGTYMRDLQLNLKDMHEVVYTAMREQVEERNRQHRADGPSLAREIRVGDSVFVKLDPLMHRKVMEAESKGGNRLRVSMRLGMTAHPTLYTVTARQGNYVYLKTKAGGHPPPFALPVSVSNLIPFDNLSIEEPYPDQLRPRLALRRNRDAGSYETYEVIAQSATGEVRLQRLTDLAEYVTDLAHEEYHWVT